MESKSFAASENWELGDADPAAVSRVTVQLVDDGSWTGSVTPMGRVRGSGAEWRELAWYNMATAADVAAGSAPTAEALMLIDASGLDIRLDVVITTGDLTIHTQRLRG